MTAKNQVLIAAAGSGKTTYIVRKALEVQDDIVLILTYTISNEEEIRAKVVEIRGFLPSNIHVRTWFSFLISDGVLPFQGRLFEFPVRGMKLVNSRSGFRYWYKERPVYWGEKDFKKYYFNDEREIYSDKLSKLVMRCDKESVGSVFDRISRIYKHIFVDEVQDLAGYDLDILKRFFQSTSMVVVVGDPRQVVYQTHHERRFEKYAGSSFVEFFRRELPKKLNVVVNDTTLNVSHRNCAQICSFSSRLYPEYKETVPCRCIECRSGAPVSSGVFAVPPEKVAEFERRFSPVVLRNSAAVAIHDTNLQVMNFGAAKGLGFDSVLIYPTEDQEYWLEDHHHKLKSGTRARLYVALTRARFTAGIVTGMELCADQTGLAKFE